MKTHHRMLWLPSVLLALAAGLAHAAPDATRGQALYVEGRLPDGRALQARRAESPDMAGAAAACVQCHRRSGLGDQEGLLRIPPITAASLFAPGQPLTLRRTTTGSAPPGTRVESRSAYTPETLARALRSGVDPDGKALSSWMPRYDLDEAAVADLLAWLERLGPVGDTVLRGLDGTRLHLATIVTPDAPADRREAVETTLAAWARQQTFGQVRVVLHVWTLTGPPAEWAVQLEQHLRAQPVYAVVSGAGAAQWAPVEAFCEAQALPCVLPSIDQVPPTTAAQPRHHTLYLSEGALAEARVAARALDTLGTPPSRLHLWFDTELGAAAAREFQALQTRTDSAVPVRLRDLRVQPLAPGEPLGAAQELVVAWLATPQVGALLAARGAAGDDSRPSLWLSAHLAPPEALDALGLPAAWRPKVRWASVQNTPTQFHAAAATGLKPWLRTLGLDPASATVLQGEVYAAAFFFTDALRRSRGAWSVEHVLERLESGVNNRAAAGRFVRLSLGPGQRIAAQVGQMQGWAAPLHQTLVPLSPVLNANR